MTRPDTVDTNNTFIRLGYSSTQQDADIECQPCSSDFLCSADGVRANWLDDALSSVRNTYESVESWVASHPLAATAIISASRTGAKAAVEWVKTHPAETAMIIRAGAMLLPGKRDAADSDVPNREALEAALAKACPNFKVGPDVPESLVIISAFLQADANTDGRLDTEETLTFNNVISVLNVCARLTQ